MKQFIKYIRLITLLLAMFIANKGYAQYNNNVGMFKSTNSSHTLFQNFSTQNPHFDSTKGRIYLGINDKKGNTALCILNDSIMKLINGKWQPVFIIDKKVPRMGEKKFIYRYWYVLININSNLDSLILITSKGNTSLCDTLDYHLLVKSENTIYYNYSGRLYSENITQNLDTTFFPIQSLKLVNIDSLSSAWIFQLKKKVYKQDSEELPGHFYSNILYYNQGRIEKKGELVLDSLHFPDLFSQVDCKAPFILSSYYDLVFNNKRDKFIARVTRLPYPYMDANSEDSVYILQFNFDVITGQISFDRIIYKYLHCKVNGVKKFPNCECFDPYPAFYSPNDKILYAFSRVGYFPSKGINYHYDSADKIYVSDMFILQFDINSTKNEPSWIFTINKIDDYLESLIYMGPDAKVYSLNTFGSTQTRLKYPDILGTGAQFEIIQMGHSGLYAYRQYRQDHPFLNLSLKNKTCTQEVWFYNNSLTNRYQQFMLFFGDGDSIVLKNATDSIGHLYNNPGTYSIWLRATTAEGYVQWREYEYTIGVAHTKPTAKFAVADTAGCQWINYALLDQSNIRFKNKSITYNWQFGDGKDTTLLFANVPAAAAASVGHTYTQNGLYKVSLIVNDGYCADTFSLQNKVNILPAPQPGILLNPSTAMGCSPLEIAVQRRHTDPIDSVIWQLGEGSQQTAYTNPAAIQHTYYHTLHNTQNYLLQQTLYGPTGCVTKDSLLINVRPGFEKGYVPTLIRASVENENTALVQWNGHPHAKGYTLFKDNAIVTETNDTFFVAPYTQVQNSAYWITANNACEQSTATSNWGQLMVLTGENTNNKTALLQWTAYQDWSKEMGVLHYTIEAKNNSTGAFETLSNNDTTYYTDNNFIQSGYYNRCYRITATQANNTNIVSHSNTLCLGYASVIFVPNAFSPNNDGLNDVFEPFNIGFKSYTLSVYNRWGEKIAEGRNWDGTTQGQTVPNGIYFYRITGKTGKDENVFLNGQVTVVR